MENKSSEQSKKLIPRIIQLDANEFDKEVFKVLYHQIQEIIKFFKPGALNNVKAELNLILNLIIFNCSIALNNATFGQQLLGLKYEKSLSQTQAIFYILLKYFIPYMWSKYEDSRGRITSNIVSNSVKHVEIFAKASQFLNLFVFLTQGKYPTITDRLLKLHYAPTDQYNKNVGYSFMTRQLLWHGFLELLTQVLPLINYKVLKRRIKMFLFSNANKGKIKTYVNHTIKTKCVICDDFPVMPCIISVYCPHLACYYCIKSNILLDDKYMCPECNEPNTASQEFNYL